MPSQQAKERRNAARRVGNDPAAVARNRARNLSRYGITPEDYDALLADQKGVCAICGEAPHPEARRAASRLHVDHDHVSGRVRGLLCVRCNPGIGHFRDDPQLMRAAIEYLTSRQ